MTKNVKCHAGKCEYVEQLEFPDECGDCDVVEQIEHDLMKKQVKG